MSRLWNSRRAAILPNSRMVYFQRNGIFHALACDAAGEIALHIIEENQDLGAASALLQQEGLSDAGLMLLDNPFILLPTAFENSDLPGFLPPTIKTTQVEKGLTIKVGNCAAEKNFHAIVPLYYIAKESAEKHKQLVYSCLIDGVLLVLFFRNGLCELANVYKVKNDSDILYFSVAPVKKAGLTVDRVHFEFLAETEELKSLMRTVSRFLPDASAAKIDLPYIAGEYPPFAPIAFLMYQYLQCELPAES